ncbi:hypothetical protein bcere0019_52480 [Bacillus cereus Rock3-28]|nr:hypothetical protein bcere0019_52480 [Bacillus cereus Rock3-28]
MSSPVPLTFVKPAFALPMKNGIFYYLFYFTTFFTYSV